MTPGIPTRRWSRRQAAFTLIELLTVIAIMALLAAIIFPVFASVRESTRRGSTITSMQQLSSAIKLYELDNRRYPDFLLTPAIRSDGSGGCAVSPTGKLIMAAPGDEVCTLEVAAGTRRLGLELANPDGTDSGLYGGLYPEYVRSLSTFHSINDSEYDTTNDTRPEAVAGVTIWDTRTTPPGSATMQVVHYKYNSFDISPEVLSVNPDRLGPAYLPRYSRLWIPALAPGADPTDPANFPAGITPEDYAAQLFWKNPGDDTYVTMTTHHVPKGKVLVLYLSGTAKVWDVQKLANQVPGTGGMDFDAYKISQLKP
jgi:prepilin-type N-terminal cleavage/methylation domain